jgi:hypothetical protein
MSRFLQLAGVQGWRQEPVSRRHGRTGDAATYRPHHHRRAGPEGSSGSLLYRVWPRGLPWRQAPGGYRSSDRLELLSDSYVHAVPWHANVAVCRCTTGTPGTL